MAYLLGTSKTTYPMKKTTKAMEYWPDVRLKSVPIPEIFAFPILFCGGVSVNRLVWITG